MTSSSSGNIFADAYVYIHIPDHIWIRFLLTLNGDKRHDAMVIRSLACELNIDPAVIVERLQWEEEEGQKAEREAWTMPLSNVVH
jgi:hypothetical protein